MIVVGVSNQNLNENSLIEKIKLLEVLDIFHAESKNGASLVCIVTHVDSKKIYARRITTQENCNFDRETGLAVAAPGESEAIIKSVKTLPIEIYQIMTGLDRRYRLGGKGLEDAKLTHDEKKALLFIDEFYSTTT
ncbi:hypothetical protein [Rhizobium sp. P28RR-XV]|uniref:hypothetical protein n=1 Tax=Rhizobium sp. P28RR-XV TaxID=2726737 RepID=UPI001457799E|nr:hypothetical protein [Rhizobium sp. P28RR-XV]NLR86389.1 hypothetical protein [Rhizobium sp. P28RR-XV]